MSVSVVLLLCSFSINLQFHCRLAIIFKEWTHQHHKKENTSNSNIRGSVPFKPYDGIFTMRISAVILFCSSSANIHFHCCSALICFIFIIIVLWYLRRVNLQNFTQHHNTTAATTKKRVGTAFVILFTSLSYNIFLTFLNLQLLFINNGWIQIFQE